MPQEEVKQSTFVRVLEAVSVVVLTSFLGWQAFTTYTIATNIVRANVQLETHLQEADQWKDRIIRLESFKSEGGRYTAENGKQEERERREADKVLADRINKLEFALQRIQDQQVHIDEKLDEIVFLVKGSSQAAMQHRKKVDKRLNLSNED